jgi:hypothetical protein
MAQLRMKEIRRKNKGKSEQLFLIAIKVEYKEGHTV